MNKKTELVEYIQKEIPNREWKQFYDFYGVELSIILPINLEDILIVLEKKDTNISVRNNGGFIKVGGFDKLNCNYNKFWKLGQTIDNQSEETISFLHDLLFN